jgi:hypothetical protein
LTKDIMEQHRGATAVAQPPLGVDAGCKHFWLIDSPNGPISRGRCKVCGALKEFKNYLESASYWDDEHVSETAVSRRFKAAAPVVAEILEAED